LAHPVVCFDHIAQPVRDQRYKIIINIAYIFRIVCDILRRAVSADNVKVYRVEDCSLSKMKTLSNQYQSVHITITTTSKPVGLRNF